MQRDIISVDGLASTGKTSLSAGLASKLGFVHFSTGQLYRGVGLVLYREGLTIESLSSSGVSKLLAERITSALQIVLSDDGVSSVLKIGGKTVDLELYTPEVSQFTSVAASFPEVRGALLALQREAFGSHPMVVEGRDVGSVVFPEAPLKFFIHVDTNVKIERRIKQICQREKIESNEALARLEEKMLIEVSERDRRDSERLSAPTVQQHDMVFIDNSADPLDIVIEKMYNIADKKGFGKVKV